MEEVWSEKKKKSQNETIRQEKRKTLHLIRSLTKLEIALRYSISSHPGNAFVYPLLTTDVQLISTYVLLISIYVLLTSPVRQ